VKTSSDATDGTARREPASSAAGAAGAPNRALTLEDFTGRLKPIVDFLGQIKLLATIVIAIAAGTITAIQYFATWSEFNCLSKKLEAKNKLVSALIGIIQTNRDLEQQSFDLQTLTQNQKTNALAPTDLHKLSTLTLQVQSSEEALRGLKIDQKTAENEDHDLVCR
jgi:hypothetical protein